MLLNQVDQQGLRVIISPMELGTCFLPRHKIPNSSGLYFKVQPCDEYSKHHFHKMKDDVFYSLNKHVSYRGSSTDSSPNNLIRNCLTLIWAFWIWGALWGAKERLGVTFPEFSILLKYLSINNSMLKQANICHVVWSNICRNFWQITYTSKRMRLWWATLCYP